MYGRKWHGEAKKGEITDEKKDNIFIESVIDKCNVSIGTHKK